ncbi:hypothetical protein [Pseudomonas oryzihabitans]|uniref:Uncharacterized protein n=1 Tax=Pseudomonas oryzihabitans TaxID=47885 RepID=A0A1G5M143_9PSED|nr:hypothetical protein [Pseudomonas psychrotolerans]NMY88951.1 hypothetical protein [Pseudomonas psychrotolerans]SCZ18915.1 hypothetical protein SAMN05216279_10110 [Pseudomonas psychrotolerans]
MEMTQSSSTHQPITLHPTLARRCRATALLGEALIRYQVSNTLGDRIHLLALASMANALGALTRQDADIVNQTLDRTGDAH